MRSIRESNRFSTMNSWLPLLLAGIGTFLLCMVLLSTAVKAQEGGYTYTVQPGDNWTVVAKRVGLSVEELQAANPQAVRRTGWLIVGEKLFIPAAPAATEQFYTVQRGDGWTTIAAQFDISPRLLQAVNPRSVRPGLVLYVGERLLIPAPSSASATAGSQSVPTAASTPVPTAPAAPTSSGEETETPAPPTETATPAPTATSTATQTEAPTPTVTPSATATATPNPATQLPACPEDLADAPALLLDVYNRSTEELDLYGQFLNTCGLTAAEPVLQDLTGDGVDDLVLTYQLAETGARSVLREGDLLIADGTAEGFVLGYVARAAGTVKLVDVQDINQDGQPDVVWMDTTCGASTCFDSLYVRSWDGSAWQDWTKGSITMAEAEVQIADVDEAGSGAELVLTGGLYGSVGAGPQRTRTEVWASVDGAPYTLLRETFGESKCLYHLILDANRALVQDRDLATAQLLFEQAITDETKVACWVRENELDELRSFALFRLALIAGYQGDAEAAAVVAAQLQDTYPDQPYAEVAQRWLEAYQQTQNPATACEAVGTFVETHPAAVEVLADYGYANPTFTPGDVCPVLPFEPVQPREQTEATEAASTPVPSPTAEETPEAGPATPAQEVTLDENLPECPNAISGFADAVSAVVELSGGDTLILETWLRVCDAMTDDRGALVLYDLNSDGQEDLLVFPVIISDVGYGPGGADGALLIFHGQEEGGYTLTYAPDVFGQPIPLAVGDANDDGRPELLWMLKSCATFCVTSVDGLVWDKTNNEYAHVVAPGAALAEGEVFIEHVASSDPGRGQQIRLVGGVSGTPGGGLTVPHTEIWQSVDGAPYQRISWTYDREVEGADCLGLRLVEADMALQASDMIGYQPAIDLYTAALENPELQACSLFGMDAKEELTLLQGLASFRLIQAQALSGDRTAAESTLAGLAYGQPDSKYTEAATKWLDAYVADGDPAAACTAVEKIFTDNAELWQITDQFGYDHPALAAEQICFTPSIP